MSDTYAEHVLDLRGVACPMNFVRIKLLIDKIPSGDSVKALLDEGEPLDSVQSSVSADGHEIISCQRQVEGYYAVVIRKV